LVSIFLFPVWPLIFWLMKFEGFTRYWADKIFLSSVLNDVDFRPIDLKINSGIIPLLITNPYTCMQYLNSLRKCSQVLSGHCLVYRTTDRYKAICSSSSKEKRDNITLFEEKKIRKILNYIKEKNNKHCTKN
jgi:hypothetical protein